MTDPYPEARRRQRLDQRTRGRPASQGRGRSRGPTDQQITEALERVEAVDVPGEPRVATARILRDGVSLPVEAGDRLVRDVRVQNGDPQHGAKRSDAHISRFEVSLPVSEIDNEAVPGDSCPECDGERARYKYSAHHYIAGSESAFCEACETKLYGEEWS